MPIEIAPEVSDPDTVLNDVQRKFNKLSRKCNIANKTKHPPSLRPQIKQMDILKHELNEALLNINVATSGRHANQAASIKNNIQQSILHYENLNNEVQDAKSQEVELNVMNRLADKKIVELAKTVPAEHKELALIEAAEFRLRRMEARLEIATEKFCSTNADNKRLRAEINMLLVERNNFSIQWNRTIERLSRGKEYLLDILEVATAAFNSRDEITRRLDNLTYKGVTILNKDISKMQHYDYKLNRLAKLEEFLRIKGSYRYCQVDEIETAKQQEEKVYIEKKMVELNDLLAKIFAYAGTKKISNIIRNFQRTEFENHSKFVCLCEILDEYINLKINQEALIQSILDQQDRNQARVDNENKRIVKLTEELKAQSKRNAYKKQLNSAAEARFLKTLNSIGDLVNIIKCDLTPLLNLLGNNTSVNRWNVSTYLKLLEREIKNIIHVVYGAVKKPPRTPSKSKDFDTVKTVADPRIKKLRPNRLDMLVPYQPCPYCVEDYILNFAYEEPVVPADKDYIESIFHLEEVNTKFGIYTLTEPGKRHPFKRRQHGDY